MQDFVAGFVARGTISDACAFDVVNLNGSFVVGQVFILHQCCEIVAKFGVENMHFGAGHQRLFNAARGHDIAAIHHNGFCSQVQKYWKRRHFAFLLSF